MTIRGLITTLLAPLALVPAVAPATTDLLGTPATRTPAVESAADVEAPVPEIDWKDCSDGLRCATVRVPLDYDEPNGRTTALALAKRPASGESIGTLFTNPGGPGESAVDYLPWYVDNLPSGVLDRFDVIGIDPRGVGASSRLRCRTAGDGSDAPDVAFPMTRKQIATALHFDRHVRRSCATGAGPIIDHMTTADVARDLDLIRQAVGDEQLTYYGISYGSVLGATYAAMFPERIRAMVVDGVMNPVGYMTGHRPADRRRPVTSRWGSAEASWRTLSAAFAECDRVGRPRCPIAGDASGTWHRVVNRLRQSPVRVDGDRLRYQDVVAQAQGALTGVSSYRPLMRFVGATHDAMFGSSSVRERAELRAAYQGLEEPTTDRAGDALSPVTQGVICADSRNPSDPRAWIGAGARSDRSAPWFGRFWTWRSSVCAGWPGSSADAYRGPFAADTSAPVLLVTESRDPSTPIGGARVLNTLLEGSRMLTLDGWGHGALGESPCVGLHVEAYLTSVHLPAPGTVCRQDEQPFPRRR